MRLDDPRLLGLFYWDFPALVSFRTDFLEGQCIGGDTVGSEIRYSNIPCVGQRHSAVHLGMLLVAQAGPKTKECEQRWEKVAVCNSEHLVLSLNAIGGIP